MPARDPSSEEELENDADESDLSDADDPEFVAAAHRPTPASRKKGARARRSLSPPPTLPSSVPLPRAVRELMG